MVPGREGRKSEMRLPGFFASVTATLRGIVRELTTTYRPERHYMRGPGPKWQARRAQAA